MDRERFLQAVDRVILEKRDREGIGRLSEKVLHAAIKIYLDPDRSHHEVKLGRMVADVKNDAGIFEIQTGSFTPLRKKLEVFLEDYPVTVVYPMADRRRIIWIDGRGEFSSPRTSPKKRQVMRVFPELLRILPHLSHPNFTFRLMLFDLDEYRLKNGWANDGKRGSTRYERIPTALKEEMDFRSPADYARLLPPGLPPEFGAAQLEKASGLRGRDLSAALTVLLRLGVLSRGKEGRAFLYRREL